MRGDFSKPLRLDQFRDGERIDLTADEGERSAIAERLSLQSLERLEAHVTLGREGERIEAKGRLRAALEQSCVATGDPVAERIDEAFAIAFVPEPGADTPEEVELSDEDCDIVFYEGGTIDLGAAIADTLALSINPYPRSPEAEIALRDAGVLTEGEAGPFAALAKLKKDSN
jgi:uncharacterized metal-binding protein YceD (DUF177 family)